MADAMTVDLKDNTINLSRVYDAPRELVFSMFSNPEHLAKWWGPTQWPATIKEFDFRAGGLWHYYMTSPEGVKFWGKGTFTNIDEPNSLTYTDAFSDENGTANPSLPQGEITFTFEPTDDGQTRLSMRGVFASAEEASKVVEMGMVEGMKDTWSQLAALLAENK